MFKNLRKDKQDEIESLCSDLEDNAEKGYSRAVFQTVRNRIKPLKLRTVAIKDNAGKKLTEPRKVCHRSNK